MHMQYSVDLLISVDLSQYGSCFSYRSALKEQVEIRGHIEKVMSQHIPD